LSRQREKYLANEEQVNYERVNMLTVWQLS